jgi:putative DNA primase/helicase
MIHYAKVNDKEKPASNDDRKWISADDMALNAKAPVYLINNIIESKSHGLIAGSSQSFKSFCVIKIAHSIATGKEFFGNEVFDTGKVLYVCGEGLNALGRRVKALSIVEGGFNNNFFILERPLFIDNIAEMDWLRQQLNELNPVLVIFDTFSSLATSTKENANEEVARTLKMVSDCCNESGSSSIVVHHYGKDVEKGSRGASAFFANVDFEISMVRANDMNVVMSCKKAKDSEYFTEISMKAHVVDLGLPRQDGKNSTSLILKAGEGKDSLTDKSKSAYDVVRDLISSAGYDFNKKLCISEEMLKSCLNDFFEPTDGRNKYLVSKRTIELFLKRGLIAHYDKNFYLI